MHKFNWDDLQIVMAVAECGSASAAAQQLGLNHSTVLRRVNAFETTQGVKLFERRSTGYRPTSAGRAILQAAREINQKIRGVQRDILGRDSRLEGGVELTTTDSIFHAVIAGYLERFQDKHPDITVNVTMTNIRLNLTNLDAEVSVRPSRNPPEDLLGRRVCGLAFAIYTAAAPAHERPSSSGPVDAPWLGTAGELQNSPAGAWFEKNIEPGQIIARSNSFVALRDLALTGLGQTVLPCCLGDRSAALQRVSDPIAELSTSLWVLMHPDLRNSARVSALSDHLARALRADKALMEGTNKPAPQRRKATSVPARAD